MKLSANQSGSRDGSVELLNAAPSISDVELIGPHPKGGYQVRFDMPSDALDEFIEYLEAGDWRFVF
jgi:hypothetical protein